MFWLEEVENGYYEITFGDGLFGKKLVDDSVINVNYLVTSGVSGNGVSGNNNFNFIGTVEDSFGTVINTEPTISSVSTTEGGFQNVKVSLLLSSVLLVSTAHRTVPSSLRTMTL